MLPLLFLRGVAHCADGLHVSEHLQKNFKHKMLLGVWYMKLQPYQLALQVHDPSESVVVCFAHRTVGSADCKSVAFHPTPVVNCCNVHVWILCACVYDSKGWDSGVHSTAVT